MSASSQVLLAHGVGGRQDLPLPFSFALAGAVIVLVATFVVLSFAWRSSRLRGGEAGRPLPAALGRLLDSPALRWALRIGGLIAAAWLVVLLVAGPDTTADSAAPGALYVLLWIWVPLGSVLLGPIWPAISPLRTAQLLLARAVGNDPSRGLVKLPSWVGSWPAAVLLGAFVWLELVPPGRATVATVTYTLAMYAALMLLGAAVFGDEWLACADPLEVYSRLAARLAPVGRRSDGVLVWRNPLEGLDSQPATPGLAAFLLVLLGSTAYDSLSESPWWLRLVQASNAQTELRTLGLLATVALLAVLYLATTLAAGRLGDGERRWRLPGRFAHSLLPIALGYIVAHYYSLAVLEGQRTLILAADLPGTGQNLFGLSTTDVSTALVTPTGVATLQVVAVIVGHVLGAVAAHDRAVRLFPPEQARLGQLPLLSLMVVYTYVGLTLLFAA